MRFGVKQNYRPNQMARNYDENNNIFSTGFTEICPSHTKVIFGKAQ